MLVLTRKSGETIQVSDDITIKVIKTGKGTVKIGIDAPRDVKVLRGELNGQQQTVAMTKRNDVSSRPLAVDLVGFFTYPQTA